MKLRHWICLVVAMTAVFAGAQTVDPERAQKSDEVFQKATKLDLLNQILPLLFTKEQYRDILPSIERARQRVRETQKLEADELVKLDKQLDAALKDAMEKGVVPPRELLTEVSKTLQKLSIARGIISGQNTQEVFDAFVKTANAGQKKAAANALSPKLFDPSAKPEEMSDDEKLRVFVREILLHPMAYDIMRKLSI